MEDKSQQTDTSAKADGGEQKQGLYRGVIFDLDGTLVDSVIGLQLAINRVLTDRGFAPLSVQGTKDRVGHGVTRLVQQALPEGHRDQETVAECEEAMRKAYAACWRQGTEPYPGIRELLTILQDAGVPCAVHTNKMQNVTNEVVAYLFADFDLQPVIGSDGGYPLKPDPAGALAIAEQWGLLPRECLFVGDSEADMQTAGNAGMLAVGVLWGFRDQAVLEAHGAEVLLQKPDQLLGLLGL